MKVYQFTVPFGKSKQEFEETLAHDHGGFTRHHGYGGWINADKELIREESYVYTVATEYGIILKNYVREYLKGLGEQAMYFAEMGEAEITNLGA